MVVQCWKVLCSCAIRTRDFLQPMVLKHCGQLFATRRAAASSRNPLSSHGCPMLEGAMFMRYQDKGFLATFGSETLRTTVCNSPRCCILKKSSVLTWLSNVAR